MFTINPLLFPWFKIPPTKIGAAPLAMGGYGEVWKASLPNGQLVAVKYLISNTPDNYKAFCREVEMLEAANYESSIVQILGHDLAATRPYYYMELCDHLGRLRRSAHTGIGYRRLSKSNSRYQMGPSKVWIPSRYQHNILMRRVGALLYPVLADFGVARIPNARTLMTHRGFGTDPYRAKEIVNGMSYQPSADIYSLGITLFELFTGSPQKPIFTLSVPTNILGLLHRMTHGDPNARPDIYQVEREIKQILEVRKSPVNNWLSSLNGGEVLLGLAAVGTALYFFGGDSDA